MHKILTFVKLITENDKKKISGYLYKAYTIIHERLLKMMMNVDSVNFTARNVAHAKHSAIKSSQLRSMKKQIESNESKINNYLIKINDQNLTNADKKNLIAKIERLSRENDRMHDIIATRSDY